MVLPAEQTVARPEFLTSPALLATLLEERLPFDVDWQQSAASMTEEERLLRLARVKALLPPDNAVEEKTTHDATLENYIRLALEAAGSRQTLDTFLSHLNNALQVDDPVASQLAQQVFWIWAPVAEIAGLYHYKSQLEETAFRVLLPDEYASICQSYDRAQLEGEAGLLESVGAKIQTQLAAELNPAIDYQMSARPKSNYSVWRKLRNESRQTAEIFDLLGYRIILDGDDALATQQCYVALAAVAAEFAPDKARFKDYIVEPKANGYQSLHLTLYTSSGLPFEVQIRTRSMHEDTEGDNILSHQAYEATYKEIPGKIQRTYQKIPKLYKWRNQATAFIAHHDGLTEGIIGDEVLCFRQDGNLYKVPRDANALDVSFYIHTRRALRTKAIYRNNRLVGYQDPIGHGDMVNIIYRDAYPTENGQFEKMARTVQTKTAQRAVERGQRQANRQEHIKHGRLIVAGLVGQIGMDDPLVVLDEADRRKLAERAGVPNFDSLLAMIGADQKNGKPTRVANWIKARCGLGQEVVIKLAPEAHLALMDDDVLANIVVPVVGGKADCIVAGCCSEKIHLGDEILVRPSKQEAILKVHLTDCVNIRDRSNTIDCGWQTA